MKIRLNLLLFFIFLALTSNGKSSVSGKNCEKKPEKKPDKIEKCEWFGDCEEGKAVKGCPDGYEQQIELHCITEEGEPTGDNSYFCCPKDANFKDKKPNHLIKADFENAKTFANISSHDIPKPAPPTQPTEPNQRNAQNFNNPWPFARVPYTLDPTFSDNDRAEVAKAIDEFQTKTCVRFFPKRSEDKGWVSIEGDDATQTATNCGQSILCGPWGGAQYSKFGGTCRNAEWMIHELGHSLCFTHEQDRYDRDKFVYFDTTVCQPSPKSSKSGFTTLDLPFDFQSSQMYPGCLEGDCIQRQKGKGKGYCGNKWDGTGRLSPIDVKKFNRYYKCDCDEYTC